MYLGNTIEAFFFLSLIYLKPTKQPPLLFIVSFVSPFELVIIFLDLNILLLAHSQILILPSSQGQRSFTFFCINFDRALAGWIVILFSEFCPFGAGMRTFDKSIVLLCNVQIRVNLKFIMEFPWLFLFKRNQQKKVKKR